MTADSRTRPHTPRRHGTVFAVALTVLATLACAALVSACGGSADASGGGGASTAGAPTQAATPTPSPDDTSSITPGEQMAVRVYFLRDEKLGVAERLVPKSEAVATAAATALCLGVNEDEKQAGLSSAVPAGTDLLKLSIKNGVATVGLTGDFASGGGSLSMQARVAQVVYTLTQYPTVKSVDLEVNGEPLTVLGGEGLQLEPGQTRADWQDFEPAIFVERPGVGAVISSPFVLQGTAVVFEGAFMAELRDASGKKLVGTPVQASAGGPERGDFRETVSFSTPATSGTVIVYAESMEDGSHQDEVRIPVRFVP
jgi:germination protein M